MIHASPPGVRGYPAFMTRRSYLTTLLALVLSATGTPAAPQAEDTVVKVIPLKHRPAADVVEVIRPLVGSEGSVDALDTRLVVRATAQAMARVEEVVRSLDAPLRSLVVTVSQGIARGTEQQSAGVGGAASAGGTTVVVSPPGPGGTTTVETRRSRTVVHGALGSQSSSESGDAVQQIRTLEGYPALIRVGRSEPVTTVGVVPSPSGPAVATGTAFAESGTGFYVLPRLAGGSVILELWAENTEGAAGGAVEGQRLRTTVTGRLGEWIEVGSALREAFTRARSLGGSTRSATMEERSVRVRVDEAR
jgi:type II secretory pathway component GspD/PulD (secretin)